ncbi:MAG: hypothetical protein GYA55_00605 [SAR324 cluster bacterium]|uniref:Uncharacterized protein n=1 Tax=SAR324 cluster bacterium TaxID=2024889 RepID=A0A7X9III9_9DELT|nr:hypothetical protein [SAR324 cluster bacterium]
MEQRQSPAYLWLQKAQPNIRWRLVGPNIKNPFDSLATEQRLEEYVGDKFALMEVCQVLAIMDESTILKITDLDALQFTTEHPNLVSLSREDLEAFLKTSGVWDKLIAEFSALQKACSEELKTRSGVF